MLARPIWSGARTEVDTNAVLFAGREKVGEHVTAACRRAGLKSMSIPTGQSVALARWSQLQSCNTAVFDLGGRSSRDRAAVAYELGIARTLGKPVVALVDRNQKIPFDVESLRMSGGNDDGAAIADAIDHALVWLMPRPRFPAVRDTIDDVLGRYAMPHDNMYVNQTLKQLERQRIEQDPIIVNAACSNLIQYLRDPELMLINPVWPPVYADSKERRLFHVMQFRPGWADAAAESAEKACVANDVTYVRGDRVSAPNIIRSIWEEINRATHVLVDLTDFNANVALELGIADTLGRRTLTVGQDNTVERLFPMIAKRRFSPYESAGSGVLEALVRSFLC